MSKDSLQALPQVLHVFLIDLVVVVRVEKAFGLVLDLPPPYIDHTRVAETLSTSFARGRTTLVSACLALRSSSGFRCPSDGGLEAGTLPQTQLFVIGSARP